MNSGKRLYFRGGLNRFTYVCVFLLFLYQNYVNAQNSDKPKEVTNTFFLQNVNVIPQPGKILNGYNVVIKNGLIENIGKGISAPYNAKKIKADSMFVYAGFIDCFSHTGVPKTESKDQPKISDPGNPPNDIAGITPQKSVLETYKSSDKSIGDHRSSGFTMVNAAPRGYMLPGQSSLFQLSEAEADMAVVKRDFGMMMQFSNNRNVYPSTVIGIIAKFRELYKNSEILGSTNEEYNSNPVGINRPVFKKEEWALYPVTQKKQPLFFVASSSNQVYRAIQLQKELGFRLILTDVKKGWVIIDDLKKQNVEILLSLDLPEEKKSSKKDSVKTNVKDSVFINMEERGFEEKRQRALEEHFKQAASFEKAGLSFGFSLLSSKPEDALKNIKKMVKYGLSEKKALEALTTYPAGLFGVLSQTGTVEKGKIANLVITDKPVFEEKSSVKYVFVEGTIFDYSQTKPTKSEKTNKDTSAISGTWSFSVNTGEEEQTGTIDITLTEAGYKIVVTPEDDAQNPETGFDIEIKDNTLTFAITTEEEGQAVTFLFNVEIKGNSFSGNVSAKELGNFIITGEKVPNPKHF